MVFNVLKVIEVEPGAELGDTVYDQWVKVEYKDHSLSLFDSDMHVPSDAAGEYWEIKVGALVSQLESGVKDPIMAKGNRFCGDVVDVKREKDFFTHIVDLDGLRLEFSEKKEHPVGTRLKFKARLDVLEVNGSTTGWKSS